MSLKYSQQIGTDQYAEGAYREGVMAERQRILDILTAYGSSSDGPENAGRWEACDAITTAILRPTS